MGSTISFLEAEQKTWIKHELVYDHIVRSANILSLERFEDGCDLFIGYKESTYMGVSFQHWFVTDKTRFFEFGGTEIDIYTARVQINTLPRTNYIIATLHPIQMNSKIRDRMRHVIGMSNYSLCFRNCEHVANYVYRNKWVSSQMFEKGTLMSTFASYMMDHHKRISNTFPSDIRPHIFPENGNEEKMYKFINEHYTATSFEYYLDCNEETYNILVLGPTGSGKSNLINTFFNQSICQSDVSHHSVTKEICFVRGQGQIYDVNLRRRVHKDVVVADTVGICDTEWSNDEVLDLIKGRVSTNFKYIDAVFFVFKADRLQKQFVDSIHNLMKWLGYHEGDNFLKFLFVGTFSEHLSDSKKEQLRQEASDILKLKKTTRWLLDTDQKVESLVYVGFPPEDSLNDKTRAGVERSWELLQPLLLNPGICNKLVTIENKSMFNTILQRIPVKVSKSCNIL